MIKSTVSAKEIAVGVSWWVSFPSSEPLDVEAGKRFKKRVGTLKSHLFNASCILAGIEPTPRQARKWNNGQGLAMRYSAQAKREL